MSRGRERSSASAPEPSRGPSLPAAASIGYPALVIIGARNFSDGSARELLRKGAHCSYDMVCDERIEAATGQRMAVCAVEIYCSGQSPLAKNLRLAGVVNHRQGFGADRTPPA